MNSLLQCLFYIKELREYFINNQNKFESGQQICKAFAEVMNELKIVIKIMLNQKNLKN